MNFKTFTEEAVVRFNAPEPPFFSFLKKLGLWMAFVAGLPLLMQQAGLDITFLPGVVHQILTVVGLVASLISKLTASTEAKKTLHLE